MNGLQRPRGQDEGLRFPGGDPRTGPGRYAPSPTGRLHLGNLRTALLAWLSARARGAPFLVRIEDLDSGRSREHWIETQLEEMRLLGLDWDGDPVRQSGRHRLYTEAIEELTRQGLTYDCFCTRTEIREAASAPHGEPAGGRYPGTCRDLTEAERTDRRQAGRPPAVRARTDHARIGFEDQVCGPVTTDIDDFVVRRNDGDFAYNLAVTIDDADQGISEVVRGADLLDTTSRQLWLYDRLGLTPPARFAHVPLMHGPDGSRLAKRHGAVTIEDQIERGRNPAGILAQLAGSIGLLPTADVTTGWIDETGTATSEEITPTELLAEFSWKKLG